MHLFESIVQACAAGQGNAVTGGFRPAEFDAALPVAVLTCIDARLNGLMPPALGIPEERLIWLRNAGNIITGPLSSTLRSLALACAVKGAREIALIGHSDCLVRKTTVLEVTERFRALGVDRMRLPEDLVGYFGLFASERQNVLRGVEHVRASPLIGPAIPVHGLLFDLATRRFEWVVNGYEELARARSQHATPGLSPAPPMIPIGGESSVEPAQQEAAERLRMKPQAERPLGGKARGWMTGVHVVEPNPDPPTTRPAPPPLRPHPLPRRRQ
jgi:carbonic anhydrase